MIRFLVPGVLLVLASVTGVLTQPVVKFAAIGDYGKWYSPGESLVSLMIHSWNPDFIITLGDNNYEHGADSTIDSNIGKYYHDYIHPYNGIFGNGSTVNKFFPSMGNHDWYSDSAHAYLNYFSLPGNERYYDYIKGNCHFFVINSDVNEPDGVTFNSVQALWLKNKLQQSSSRFKIVYFHHAPYSSGQHGNSTYMQWPFKQWGASVVLCGHDHDYERLVGTDGMTYFVNGLGGKDWRDFGTIVPQSRKRFTGNFGALFISAYQDSINFKFYANPDSLKDDTTFVLPPLGTEPGLQAPYEFSLSQNFPNPFNPLTSIRFQIREPSIVKLIIYDLLGKPVAVLRNQKMAPGSYDALWDASYYPSGVYFFRITTGSFSSVKKMMLVK